MTTIFWTLLCYCVLERVGELVVSRRNQKRMLQQGFSEKESAAGLRAMIVLHVGWYISTVCEVVMAPTQIAFGVQTVAVGAFVVAQLLRFWTLHSLGTYWNISVVTTDEKLPRFVIGGPYRFIRHPNYIVVIVELATLPLIGGALATACIFTILNALVLWRRIALEESYLMKVPGYRETLGKKRRFFPWPSWEMK